jgi:hypothetical protein
MIRIAIIHYLVMAVAIGPSICCCNSSTMINKLAAVFSFSNSGDQSASAFQCPYHKAVAQSHLAKLPTSSRAPTQPAPNNDQCPCRKERTTPAFLCLKSDVDVTPQLTAHELDVAVDMFVLFEVDLSSGSIGANFPIVSASPIGGDILRAYQHFRC